MPGVSVIIPVYNSEKYLKRCLTSVLNQTLSNIEIICVNDCSTDSSLEILKNYDVKIIDLKENKGASFARNLGIKKAQGEFLAFIDSDDYIKEDFLEKLYKQSFNKDVVKGSILDSETRTITPFYDMNSKIKENKSWFYYGFTSAIYRREFILHNNILFPEDISFFEDPFFSIQVLINTDNIQVVDDAEYYYYQRPDSLSKTLDLKDLEKSYGLIFEQLNSSDLSEEDYLIVYDFLYEFIIEKMDIRLLSKTLDWCKYSTQKYIDITIDRMPPHFKPRFLMKKRSVIYA